MAQSSRWDPTPPLPAPNSCNMPNWYGLMHLWDWTRWVLSTAQALVLHKHYIHNIICASDFLKPWHTWWLVSVVAAFAVKPDKRRWCSLLPAGWVLSCVFNHAVEACSIKMLIFNFVEQYIVLYCRFSVHSFQPQSTITSKDTKGNKENKRKCQEYNRSTDTVRNTPA